MHTKKNVIQIHTTETLQISVHAQAQLPRFVVDNNVGLLQVVQQILSKPKQWSSSLKKQKFHSLQFGTNPKELKHSALS